ncbi:hypothetical protein AXG93_3218s1190 [Marchantia polymorpha subsp. ruderalis]|uniref:Uncharacterized protein n=1 Tax=Marchantia polymorpha subsp. ruderalis TaxID=1480154 RepID=A0A176WH45_MARPO|nr:hypothetical protein AXG93_3218s1190 [Marchantia polymorpha subsp. ruderalis]
MSEVEGPRTPLQRECAASDFGARHAQRVRAMLDSGSDPNELDGFQRSALNLLCSQTGHTETVRRLLEAGADVMSQDMWGRLWHRGISPPFLVVMLFSSGMLELSLGLVDHDARLNVRRTPLHWCADRGWLESAHLLLEKGALVNVTTKNGDSVLLWAAKAGHPSLVELFLKAGCDPLLRNNRDERALDVAKDDVIRALLTSKLEESEDIDFSSPSSSPQPSPVKEIKRQPLPSVAGLQHPPTQAGEKTDINLEEVKPSSTSSVPTNSAAFSSYSKHSVPGPGPKKLKITFKKK